MQDPLKEIFQIIYIEKTGKHSMNKEEYAV